MEEKLIGFIRHEFLDEPSEMITVDTKLISGGLIDSFSLVSLQGFIESEFRVKIPAPRITPESFDTVRQMVAMIKEY